MPIRFVASSAGNAFMTELFEALAGELRDQGADAQVVLDGFPDPEPGLAYAIVPHEFFAVTPQAAWPSPEQLARTVAIGTEQPGTVWSDLMIRHARRCGAVMDISQVGLVELARVGVRAERLTLGYTARWDAWGGDRTAERPVDVLFMGTMKRRRDVHLSSYADVLAPREVRLLLPAHRPKTAPEPAFLLGAEKHALIAASTVMLNIRSQIPPYFEWLRAIEAISNGAVLVTEHGAGHAPLIAGEHYVGGAPESLGLLADALLREPGRAAAIRDAAYALLRDELPMAPGAMRLGEVAAAIADARAPRAPAAVPEPEAQPPQAPDAAVPEPAAPEPGALPGPRLPDFTDPANEPVPAPSAAPGETGRRLRATTLALRAQQRVTEALRVTAAGGDPEALEVVAETPAYAAAAPRVTVCVPLFEQPAEVVEALLSVAVQDLDDVDLIVHDDASGDDSAQVVARFLAERPWLPARLVRRAINGGLPRARNTMLSAARAPLALMLDADNALYPQAARRLAAALDGDPGATFAYGALAIHRDGRPDGLLSAHPWDPAILRERNPVDALALLRREAVLALGGYTEDDRLHGWEDYELWARIAAAGGRGVLANGYIGRYRRAAGSMLALTDLDVDGMRALLAELHPAVMAEPAQPAAELPSAQR